MKDLCSNKIKAHSLKEEDLICVVSTNLPTKDTMERMVSDILEHCVRNMI